MMIIIIGYVLMYEDVIINENYGWDRYIIYIWVF